MHGKVAVSQINCTVSLFCAGLLSMCIESSALSVFFVGSTYDVRQFRPPTQGLETNACVWFHLLQFYPRINDTLKNPTFLWSKVEHPPIEGGGSPSPLVVDVLLCCSYLYLWLLVTNEDKSVAVKKDTMDKKILYSVNRLFHSAITINRKITVFITWLEDGNPQ